MKNVMVDGKEYWLKDDIQKEYVKKTSIRKDKFKFFNKDSVILSTDNVLGIGSFKLSGLWAASRVSIEYLKKILKAYEVTEQDAITIIWTENYPVIFGKIDKNKGEASGFILAPRTEK